MALGQQAIGFAPFGIDYTGYVNFPLGAKKWNDETLAPFAMNYRLVGPMMRELAQWSFDGKVRGVAEKKGTPAQTLELGAWKAIVSYGLPQFGFGDKPPGNPEPVGRALIVQLGDGEFLVAGFHCRVDFQIGGAGRVAPSSASTCASKKAATTRASSSRCASGTATRPTGASTSRRPRRSCA